MMLEKKQCYGFNGFQGPSIPRAPRSARTRTTHKRKHEDAQICAIEVLASLAGKLLQDGEGSSASSNASEPGCGFSLAKEQDVNKKPKGECLDQGSSGESFYIPSCASQASEKKYMQKAIPIAETDSVLERSPLVAKDDPLENVPSDLKSEICESVLASENSRDKVKGGYHNSGESFSGYVGNEFCVQGKAGLFDGKISNGYNNSYSSNEDLCSNRRVSMNSESDVKLTTYRECKPMSLISRFRNDVKVGNRDDDEKYTRLDNNYTMKAKAFRPSTRIGDRRVRKLLSSKYRRVAPKLNDYKFFKTDGRMKSHYHKRKISSSRERYYSKRRKLFEHSIIVASDGGFRGGSISNFPEKGMRMGKENGVLSSVIGNKAGHSMSANVKFRIKSFRIPEIIIEVPETATVGSLKRSVVDAMTAILGAGVCVGLHLQGKKVRDDSKTLLQTGLTSKENLDNLGFVLEPSLKQAPTPVCTKDPPVTYDTSQLVTRSPTTTVLDSAGSELQPVAHLANSADNIESSHESVHSQTDTVTNTNLSESRALVTVPPGNADALVALPTNQKAKRSELVQRRTRRPFSVSEVEALVRAVEELGTGRWRDVKLRSFENADHRTYVDLKDKWKTLVHTAKIAPQQRRGEPVPQDLLDRVLAADAYWSQYQVKHHSKSQTTLVKICEASEVTEDMGTVKVRCEQIDWEKGKEDCTKSCTA